MTVPLGNYLVKKLTSKSSSNRGFKQQPSISLNPVPSSSKVFLIKSIRSFGDYTESPFLMSLLLGCLYQNLKVSNASLRIHLRFSRNFRSLYLFPRAV